METQVIDLNGAVITVTNLNGAIELAERCMSYSHLDPSFKEFDKTQQAYWSDLYQKLCALQKDENPSPKINENGNL